MAKNRKASAPFPSREAVLEFINEHAGKAGKREIARAFNLDADQKRELKKLLRELTIDGHLQRGRGRRYAAPRSVPDVTVLVIARIDENGDLLAEPPQWPDDAPMPRIYMAPARRGQPALGIGDRVLARVSGLGDGAYQAKTIKRLAAASAKFLGVYDRTDKGGRLRPTNKRQKSDYLIAAGDDMGAEPGELVRAEAIRGKAMGLRQARVVERLSAADGGRNISAIAIHEHGIPEDFSPDSTAAAEAAGPAPSDGRECLRDFALITIDGADARDFDDAVWAEADPDPGNPGGWRALVAIADVSWYVRPGSALDQDARDRGNSVYFPDRVVPMLPEALSNGWCSLAPKEDRPCLALHLWISSEGRMIRHKFVRGIMRSAARLTYEQVQRARDGHPDDDTGPLLETVIAPLYGVYGGLLAERTRRNALDMDLPERQIDIGPDGMVRAIRERERLDSHRLVEELMIAANIAAAEALESRGAPCVYRVHDRPSLEKTEALNQFLRSMDLQFAKGQVPKPMHFNQILRKAAGTPESQMINQMVLRSQSQAEYSARNIGHFGLALGKYAHFTSPIRRYADLLVHRSLIAAFKLGPGGLNGGGGNFEETARHVSVTERRAVAAERDAADRFTAHFLADRVGATFDARINGVSRAGLFVTLAETGADGLVPIRTLPDDYYDHDERTHTLTGRTHGLRYRLGQDLEVRLEEAAPLKGALIFSVMGSAPAGSRRRSRPPGRRRGGAKGRGRRSSARRR